MEIGNKFFFLCIFVVMIVFMYVRFEKEKGGCIIYVFNILYLKNLIEEGVNWIFVFVRI